MKLVFISKLIGNEVLGKSIFDSQGKVLLKRGTILDTPLIAKLKNNGAFFVYVEDKDLEDVTEDKKLTELKQVTLSTLPTVFNDFLNCNQKNLRKSLNMIEDLTCYISEVGTVNVNLYEVKTYDNYTYVHCVDTSIMATFLGVSSKLPKDKLKDLGTGAILHDIGKTKISNDIINKPGRLTKEEFAEIRNHPIYGTEILKKTDIINDEIISIVLQHHERIDGKGYPYGLTDNQITPLSKIVSVCDVFTAVSANRSYRPRFNPNEAYELILSGANTMFDMNVVNHFRNNFAVYPLGCCVRLSNGIEGFVVKQNEYFADKPIIRITYDKDTKQSISPYEINLIDKLNVVIESVVI